MLEIFLALLCAPFLYVITEKMAVKVGACVMSDDDDEYDCDYDEPVVMTASGDHHHGDAFGDVDEGITNEDEPHIGIVHSNGDGWCQPYADCYRT